MTFGNNHLTLSYRPGSSSRTGFSGEPSSSDPTAGQAGPSGGADGGALTISWNAVDALAECGVGEGWEERVGGGVQVSMAEQWSKPRYVPYWLPCIYRALLRELTCPGLHHHCCLRHHYRLCLSSRTTGPTPLPSPDPWRVHLYAIRSRCRAILTDCFIEVRAFGYARAAFEASGEAGSHPRPDPVL